MLLWVHSGDIVASIDLGQQIGNRFCETAPSRIPNQNHLDPVA